MLVSLFQMLFCCFFCERVSLYNCLILLDLLEISHINLIQLELLAVKQYYKVAVELLHVTRAPKTSKAKT